MHPALVGARGKCPRCGHGALFTGLLTVREKCDVCDLDFAFEDSGDGPTVLIMMVLGFVILGAVLWVEFTFFPPGWVHLLLWPPVILALGLPVLRATKGALIALQYAHGAAPGRIDRQ
ncbi:MAG: DUF983 domain-containing protein [Pseudomonadota bacterium]